MTNQKPTLEELIEWIDTERQCEDVCRRPFYNAIRARLLAEHKMSEALRFYADPNHPKERRPIVPYYIDPAQAASIGTPPDFGIVYTDNSGHVARVALVELEKLNG